jgi:hypothetical protein
MHITHKIKKFNMKLTSRKQLDKSGILYKMTDLDSSKRVHAMKNKDREQTRLAPKE